MKNLLPVRPDSSRFFRNSLKNVLVGLSNNRRFVVLGLIVTMFVGFVLPNPFNPKSSLLPSGISPVAPAKATSAYYNFTGGNLTLTISAATSNLITSNDNWSGVNSIEGYFGRNLTATHGVDPQTVLGTEFPSNQLPTTTDTQVNANKGNPSAYNAGGVTEFDQGPEYGMGFQGNVQANPYMVFYLNTTGHTNVYFSYTATDLDGGSNNSVSPVALQYRVGETGLFTNIPAGHIADATAGGTAGQTVTKSLLLPAACSNQSQLQVRLITTNAANTSGGSTPDEWIGINNVVVSVLAPTAASVSVGGRVTSADGSAITRANLTLTGIDGVTRTTSTNSFGYYEFDEVQVDQTYVVEVSSRRYSFSQPTQMVFVSEATKSLDFEAAPGFYDFRPKSTFFKR